VLDIYQLRTHPEDIKGLNGPVFVFFWLVFFGPIVIRSIVARSIVIWPVVIWPVVIHQDQSRGAFTFVKLARIRHSKENPDRQTNDGKADQNKQGQNVHGYRRSRAEFKTTTSELVAIPTEASKGLIQPATANGIATTL
jgi:hypothetical protein